MGIELQRAEETYGVRRDGALVATLRRESHSLWTMIGAETGWRYTLCPNLEAPTPDALAAEVESHLYYVMPGERVGASVGSRR